jgi:predicted glycogen debranching enzyme
LDEREWLEADGLGGYASGTAAGPRTRGYHALLLAATTPPTGRMVLVNGLEAWATTPAGTFTLSSQRYTPDVVYPDGARRVESFTTEPWPRWTFRLEDGTRLDFEVFVPHGRPAAVLSWRLLTPQPGVTLTVRLLHSGRDYHSQHHENPAFRFDAEVWAGRVAWHPYPGVPGVIALTNGEYAHAPQWYRNFLYTQERARGLACVEDLASPGTFRWDLSGGEAVCVLAADLGEPWPAVGASAESCLQEAREQESRRRGQFASPLHRAADAYLVRRGTGRTVIAGYPWFTDWGRDTFISLRGLCLATGRLDVARTILVQWAGAVSEGMLPNRFPDRGEQPEYNSVDAALWYVVAVYDFLHAAATSGTAVSDPDQEALIEAVEAILSGHARGTRHGIRLDDDGLLAAGAPDVSLTWMDARIDGHGVTPRIGKPVEVQALWLNALHLAGRTTPRWAEVFHRGRESFTRRFWYESGGYLYDVVDVDHQRARVDASFRPNQVLAVGGLPLPLLEGERARRVVDAVGDRLWTPLGLRTLAPGEPGYVPRYDGGVPERTRSYHQGTAWPWLAGPYVEAWVRVRGGTAAVKEQARKMKLELLLAHLNEAGIGHVSEVADGDAPHTPRGCPFQAWSLGELLRLHLGVLAGAGG